MFSAVLAHCQYNKDSEFCKNFSHDNLCCRGLETEGCQNTPQKCKPFMTKHCNQSSAMFGEEMCRNHWDTYKPPQIQHQVDGYCKENKGDAWCRKHGYVPDPATDSVSMNIASLVFIGVLVLILIYLIFRGRRLIRRPA
jgi:hypothetical protein